MAGNQEKGDVPEWTKPLKLKDPHLDMDLLLNPKNLEKIKENITNRKGVGDIQALVSQQGSNPLCTNVFFLLAVYNKLGMVHCIY